MIFNAQHIENNGIQLWTETFGNNKNPAILLIAGAMAPARFWSNTFCTYLTQKRFFVIRYDHRDSGLSCSIDYAQSPYTIDDLLKDALTILDVYNITKAHVVGHSMGGMLALLCAFKHPARCQKVTAISDGLLSNRPLSDDENKILERTWKILLANKPSLNYENSLQGFLTSYKYLNGTSKHLYMTADNQVKAFEVPHNHVKALESLNVKEKDLQTMSIPTLIIHGEEDYIALPSQAKATAQAIPGSTLVMIPKMGHMIFNRDLEKNLAKHIVAFHETDKIF